MDNYNINHLKELEAESIFVIREVAAQFDKPVMLFSGGKDSIVMYHLARKAFWPMKVPFPLLHIDTGHNFQETLDFGMNSWKKPGDAALSGWFRIALTRERPLKKQVSMPAVICCKRLPCLMPLPNLNLMLPWVAEDVMRKKHGPRNVFFPIAMNLVNGIRKISVRNSGTCFNGRKRMGEHFRVFPLSNWTEMDVWQYIYMENVDIPNLIFYP